MHKSDFNGLDLTFHFPCVWARHSQSKARKKDTPLKSLRVSFQISLLKYGRFLCHLVHVIRTDTWGVADGAVPIVRIAASQQLGLHFSCRKLICLLRLEVCLRENGPCLGYLATEINGAATLLTLLHQLVETIGSFACEYWYCCYFQCHSPALSIVNILFGCNSYDKFSNHPNFSAKNNVPQIFLQKYENSENNTYLCRKF